MKRIIIYGAVLAIVSFGLSAPAAAKDHDRDHRRREVREVKHEEHHHARVERHEHERHGAEHHERSRQERLAWERRERERREWARRHKGEHTNKGHHEGWERGRYNPHDHDGAVRQPVAAPATTATHAARPVQSGYNNRPVRTAHMKPSADVR